CVGGVVDDRPLQGRELVEDPDDEPPGLPACRRLAGRKTVRTQERQPGEDGTEGRTPRHALIPCRPSRCVLPLAYSIPRIGSTLSPPHSPSPILTKKGGSAPPPPESGNKSFALGRRSGR